MMKLPIRYFTDFDKDTDKLEFPKHTLAFDLIRENGDVVRFSDNGKHKPFITNIYKERIDKATEYIENNCILSDEWTDLGFCNFVPTGRIKYKQLSSKKVKDLLDILRGDK